ncbi:MAG: hypothetical protein KF693_09790 [Nitrospira sp.]|nr:hypothetical protein [Nitrospira sp.]
MKKSTYSEGQIAIALRRHFLCEPIQSIIGAGDRRRDRPFLVLLLHLRDPVSREIVLIAFCPIQCVLGAIHAQNNAERP